MKSSVVQLDNGSNFAPYFDFVVAFLDRLSYSETTMYSETYKNALAELLRVANDDLLNLGMEEARLQSDLFDVQGSISERREEILRFEELLRRAEAIQITLFDRDEAKPLAKEKSFTSAVAFVLQRANRDLSPKEIKTRIEELGYDTSEYKTDVISSVHTILKRFLAADPPKIVETGEPRRKYYRWISGAEL